MFNLLVINYWNFIKTLSCLFQRQLSMTNTHRTGMTSGQLPDFIRNDDWPPLQIRLNHGPSCLGRDVGGLSQVPSKTQINHRTQRSVAGDPGQPVTGTEHHSFTLWLKRCPKADGEQLFEDENWLSVIRHHSKIPLFKKKTLCVVSVTLCFGANVFSVRENR